jgi:hypothetical protein
MMTSVLAHVLHTALEPAALLVVPGAIVAAWQWRDNRRRRSSD